MLERYALSPMKELWTLEAQYQRWLAVELAALEALEELGQVPPGTAQLVRARARLDVAKILAAEREVGHDLIAFLWVLEEEVGPEGRWLHFGLTSSDVKDTALALLLREALEILAAKARELGEVLVLRAREHKNTVMLGRTHGQWAELTTFGLKFLLWYDELRRVEERLVRAKEAVSVGKLSGAVGTYGFFPPEAEERALRRLGLAPCPVASQVISRDRYAEVFFALASAASLVEKIALEIRLLSRAEVGEVAEGRPEGSSAMPHKRNPILSERLCGLARLVRAALGPALENNALWHERDMSHSSVERVLFPQSFVLVDYMLSRAAKLLRELVVFPERMRRNVEEARGFPFSEGLLLALVRAGMGRKEAHGLVAELSRRAAAEGRPLAAVAQEEARVRALVPDLAAIFCPERALAHVEAIYRRVLGG
ncbi:MAG: adenylosuccinate lyase [Candidatus Bipolaricaulota bacterium]|nr:adenylosuccinate lyase [Candidatus Bipolaricaulota bacterium]MCX7844006.1 adenylosuccinate lyase [Candidatus Bipolaricaulota bacterium]MDW8151760.1 adenylosuccinate lyase [Candidatus Bipolaricaulota bacterium]